MITSNVNRLICFCNHRVFRLCLAIDFTLGPTIANLSNIWCCIVQLVDFSHCQTHTSYLSRTHGRCPCKFFLAGVNFYRFNAKNWHFRQILHEKVAFFGVNFILQKFCLCKKNDKYKVCIPYTYCWISTFVYPRRFFCFYRFECIWIINVFFGQWIQDES